MLLVCLYLCSMSEKRKFSYSQLTKFYQCEHAWFLRYEKKLEEQNNVWAMLGSMCHDLIEKLVKNEINKETAIKKFEIEFKKITKLYPFPFNDKKNVESYHENLLRYFTNFEPFKGEPFDVELRFEIPIGEDLMVGLIDLPIKYRNKTFIIDHKISTPYTGKKLMENKRQLYVYAEAIKQKYGEYPDGVMYNYFKTGDKFYETFDEEFHQQTMNWVKLTIAKIKKAENFPANYDSFFCKNLCGLRQHCATFKENNPWD